MLSALEIAKRNGAKLIAVNPLREAGLINFRNPQKPRGLLGHGTDLADIHLPIKINGDLALFQAFGKLLVSWDAIDTDFLARYTRGFETWRDHVRALSWEESPMSPVSAGRRSPKPPSYCATPTRQCSAGPWA